MPRTPLSTSCACWAEKNNELAKRQIKQAFESDGFIVLRSFLSDKEVDEVRQQIATYLRETVPTLPPMDVFYQKIGDSSSIKQLPRLSEHDPFFHNLLHGKRFKEIADFLWSRGAIPRDAAYFDKPASISDPTPPHQDGYYFHITPCVALTMWLALDHANHENGCVRYVKGSHRLGMRPHDRTDVLGFSQGIVDFGNNEDQSNEVAVAAQPGDLIIHDALTIHRADANRSDDCARPALGFVYYSSQAKIDHESQQRYQDKLVSKWKATGKI